MRPILICVALLCASGQTLATESRQLETDTVPATDCPSGNDTGDEMTAEGDTSAAAAARRSQKPKPASTTPRASSGNGTVRGAPRWHSFLPGMFR